MSLVIIILISSARQAIQYGDIAAQLSSTRLMPSNYRKIFYKADLGKQTYFSGLARRPGNNAPTEHGLLAGRRAVIKTIDSILISGEILRGRNQSPRSARSRRSSFWSCQIGRGRFGHWPSAPALSIKVIPDIHAVRVPLELSDSIQCDIEGGISVP